MKTEVRPRPSISVEQAVDLERQAKGRVNVVFAPGFQWEHIDFNLDNPLLRDVRVRQAIAHGINRTQIIQQFFGGKQAVAHSLWPLQHPAYTDSVPRYSYDPARALLKDAGFGPGPDGVMQKADGQPTILCAANYGSSSIPSEANGWRGLNYPGYRSAEMDRICQAARREVDEARLKNLLNEAARVFARDLPALPLYVNAIPSAAKADLQNYNPGMVADPWNAHTWYWR